MRYGRGGKLLLRVASAFAIAGGLVFVVLVGMEVVSIVGRKLFAWSVPGDVELLQMCAAAASAAFFAHCHLARGDVKVDFLTDRLPPHCVAWLDALASALVALFGFVVAWRTAAAALVALEFGETSAVLEWPVWIPQALMVPGFALLGIAGLYRSLHFLRAAVGLRRASR